MQPQVPRRANLLQSRRFLTHQPTFAPAQALGGLDYKREDEVNAIRPPLASQQLAVSDDVSKGSVLSPNLISRSDSDHFDLVVSTIELVQKVIQRPLWLICISVAIVIASVCYPPTARASTQLSSHVFQVIRSLASAQSFVFPFITCPLWLCKAESLESPPDEAHDLTIWSDGAFVVEDFTSPTFSNKDRSWWKWWKPNTAVVHWAGPIAVLDPEISCWSFEGPSGFITLRLIGNASIASIQIAHTAGSHLQKFAPQDFTVWALVDSNSFSTKEIPHHSTPPPNLDRLVSNGFYPIQLGAFSYKVVSHAPGQSFAVNTGVLGHYGGRVDKVMFHFLSNWGAKRTCVYHLRVFGNL